MIESTRTLTAALCLATSALGGCYAVHLPDGQVYVYPPGVPPGAVPLGADPSSVPQWPAVLNARLYPANDIAAQTGGLSGTVTNMMTGRGRFQLNYHGEVLTGEATRVDGDSRRGVASAYGPGGTYMSCEYQMNTPRQGAGTCTFSNGAKYQVHIGG
jgi:hypothetical protein